MGTMSHKTSIMSSPRPSGVPISPHRPSKKDTSRFRGVHLPRPKSAKFVAKIGHNCRTIYIGSYKTEFAAAAAYDSFALSLKGQSATLNFPSCYGTLVASEEAEEPSTKPKPDVEIPVDSYLWL